MGSLWKRELVLEAPLDVEALWRRLTGILPALVRAHALHPHRDDPLHTTLALPALSGPVGSPGETRRFECSENGVSGTLSLLAVEREGLTHFSVSLWLLQRTVSFGLTVLSAWSLGTADAVPGLGLEVTGDLFPEVLAIFHRVGAHYTPPPAIDLRGLFVSPSGDASNPGTLAAPLDKPSSAARLAAREGKVVFVAAGHYVDEVVTSVSLFGGYSPDFTELDPKRFVTEIAAPDGKRSSAAVTLAGDDVIVHGFVLRGGKSTDSHALKVDAVAGALIVRNRLHGGGAGPSPSEVTFSHGVSIGSAARPAIALIGNTIHGGCNERCVAVDGLRAGARLEGNTLTGGASLSSTTAIRAGGAFTLRGNTIDAGTGTSAVGVLAGGSGATIVDNTFTTSHGDWRLGLVLEGDPLLLSGNTLDGAPDHVHFAFARKPEPVRLQED